MAQAFAVRVVLQALDDVRLHAHHAAALYGLLAAAFGAVRAGAEGIPDGVLLDAPEQCRTRVTRHERYAFGATLLAESPTAAQQLLGELATGLATLGARPAPDRPAWGGNFVVASVEDRVANSLCSSTTRLAPIPAPRWDDEANQLAALGHATLRFTAPLRCERGDHDRRPGHAYFDRECFPVPSFLFRLGQRLARWGLIDEGEVRKDAAGRLTANELVWLDLTYGPPQRRKPTGGAVGRVRIDNLDMATARLLVRGQYARVGEGTKFGFGAYRVEELGPDPFPCPRAVSLLDLALRTAPADPLVLHTVEQLWRGAYLPGPVTRLTIPLPGGGERIITLPTAADAALQRAVRDALAPALARFFEDSSLATRHIVQAVPRDGFRFALRADCVRNFDAIDHGELWRRLEAQLADDALVALLRAWTSSTSPGLPAGSPLAPLLADVLLDDFQAEALHAGSRLARHDGDLFVLSRTLQQAAGWYDAAWHQAEALEAALNRTQPADVAPQFDHLGHRFTRTAARWSATPLASPPSLLPLGTPPRRG